MAFCISRDQMSLHELNTIYTLENGYDDDDTYEPGRKHLFSVAQKSLINKRGGDSSDADEEISQQQID